MLTGWLRQSTAVTVSIGPFVDSANGNDEETGLTISQADVRLKKNNGDAAQKNESSAATHDEMGVYDCALNTTDTNTLGLLTLFVHESGALIVRHDYLVLPPNVYDALVAGTDALDVSLIQWLGSAPNALQSGRVDAYVGAKASGVGLSTQEVTDLISALVTSGIIVHRTTIDTVNSQTSIILAAGASADNDAYNDCQAVIIDASTAAQRAVVDIDDYVGASRTVTLAAAPAFTIAASDIVVIVPRSLTRAQAQAAALAAIQSYDPPTNAEMEARTLTAANYATAAAVADVPTVAEFEARTLAAADYATAAGVADVPTVAEFEARTLVAANYATAAAVADVPTVAEFEARTIPAANYALDSTVAKEATLADVPTNAELAARTLAAADYATAAEQATADGKLNNIYAKVDTEIQGIIDALAAAQTTLDDLSARLPAALVSGRMASDAQAINGSTAAAIRQALAAGQIIPFTVTNAGFSPTVTEFEVSDITTAAADHWNTRLVLFTSGTLAGQIASISAYALASGRGHFTVSTLTSAPANGATGVVL